MNSRDHEKLLDLAKMYCPDASTPIAEKDWEQAVMALMIRIRALSTHLQGLTPGGPDYVGDPEKCIEYVERLKWDAHLWQQHSQNMQQAEKVVASEDQ
ncbi:MAG: hypothetical protein AAGB04_16045 [Pseudomonadota bacterium]